MKFVGKLLISVAAIAAFSGSAMAADLYVAPPMAPAPMAAAVSNWDGLYVGAFLGYASGTVDNDLTSIGGPSSSTYTYAGMLAGVQGGYNFHISDMIVAGVSADLAWTNASGSTTIGGSAVSSDLRWTGSVTGRLGVDLNGIVPYVLGGVAFINNDATVELPPTLTDNETHTGYTVGAGVEFALADNLSADVEYRYSNYGTRDYSSSLVPGVAIPATLSDNSIRVGLNLHFH